MTRSMSGASSRLAIVNSLFGQVAPGEHGEVPGIPAVEDPAAPGGDGEGAPVRVMSCSARSSRNTDSRPKELLKSWRGCNTVAEPDE